MLKPYKVDINSGINPGDSLGYFVLVPKPLFKELFKKLTYSTK